MEEIAIHTPTIQLDQLLKWAGIAETGGHVKLMIENGMIELNGVTVTERRKKIQVGDIITIADVGQWQVTSELG